MNHHAYFFAGNSEEGIEAARTVALSQLNLSSASNPDLVILTYGLFSVDDARSVFEMATRAPTQGEKKMIVISTPRIFHEAQNALLKLLEEPPKGVTVVLVIPSEGILLPTLRSRLLPLPGAGTHKDSSILPLVKEFIIGSEKEREKAIAKLLDKTKSEKEEEKQRARADAISLISGLLEASYRARTTTKNEDARKELTLFMKELDTFMPILHDRSAPLKLIFEHVLLVIPTTLGNTKFD